MLFFHVVADYNLQGWLASAKQKSYWQENAPDKLYRYDYIMALIMHSISWTFMVMLPIAYVNQFNVDIGFVGMFIANVAIHAVVDHLKANMKLINLWHDQLLHLGQIGLMCLLII
jgi:hypothetical protein